MIRNVIITHEALQWSLALADMMNGQWCHDFEEQR